MQIKVKNREALLSHGDAEGRKIVLDITEKTLQQLDAYERIKRITHMEGDELCIGSRRWDLSKKRNVYLLGAGKACNHMAMAIDEILGDYLTRGIAIVKISEPTDVFHKTEVYVGGHPLPNAEGLRACKEIIRLIDGATADDLFIVVISGGSSALMSCPIEGISLQDEIDTTDIMLKSGAGIYEINAIRRHISAMNGGMLAKRIRDRGAELIGFGISDAVGTPATGDIGEPYKNYKGTPMGPDQTTLEEARQVIRDYGVADRLPKSVVDYLMHVGPEGETPKAFPENTYFLLNSLPDSCLTAKRISEEMGIPAVILTSYLEGEAREVGSGHVPARRRGCVRPSAHPAAHPRDARHGDARPVEQQVRGHAADHGVPAGRRHVHRHHVEHRAVCPAVLPHCTEAGPGSRVLRHPHGRQPLHRLPDAAAGRQPVRRKEYIRCAIGRVGQRTDAIHRNPCSGARPDGLFPADRHVPAEPGRRMTPDIQERLTIA